MAVYIPKDISTAPYWVVRTYVEAYKRSQSKDSNDPEEDARMAVVAAWKRMRILNPASKKKSG